MKELIESIIERWFILEPTMFAVMCTHGLVENTHMDCPIRSGKQRIEYNPSIVNGLPRQQLEEILKAEAIRILLKHPYERKPDLCTQTAISIGSNITLSDHYNFQHNKLEHAADFGLEEGHTYEWYCYQIQKLLPKGDAAPPPTGTPAGSENNEEEDSPKSNGSSARRDLCELWEEDELMAYSINKAIENAQSWGSIPGTLVSMILASTKTKIDWRSVLSGFRASILSSKRDLTRMRPNRRFDFEQMGSRRRFISRLLVAVDVSGSISDQTLTHFYGVINSAFRYGFEAVDVVQFDCGISEVHNIKKAAARFEITGRSGTSFDEPIQYAFEKSYDGLLILTDGYAPQPQIPEGFRTKIMWVCESQACYEQHHDWMEKYGRVCTMILP